MPQQQPVSLFEEESIPILEGELQRGVYSARSAHGLLRLYHFFPARLNAELVEVLFLRGLMALPEPDFVQSLSLLPEAARTPALPLLVELEHLLQKAQFSEFWARAREPVVEALLARAALAPAFADAVRAFIAAVLLRAYRRISLPELACCLALEEGPAREWAARRGWAVAAPAAAGAGEEAAGKGAAGVVMFELPASADNTPRAVKKVGEDGLGLKFAEVASVLGKL